MADLLAEQGFVPFTDESARACFDAFSEWATTINAWSPDEENSRIAELLEFYKDLEDHRAPSEPLPPHADHPEPAWVRTSRYVYSWELLDGFFAGVKNGLGSVLTRTVSCRGEWLDLCDEMTAGNGVDFNEEEAAEAVNVRAIEVQLTPDGCFATPNTSDGRHRTVALVALKAPVMPVLLVR